ncbi:MAG: methionyl-tRNA formyltransferase [Patescibacteria group bacterium]|nr:methionyl-tRNA formyltransferase [Patescibacteria group bacterium]
MSRKTYNAVFFGTPEFSVPVFDALRKLPGITITAAVTQPDKPVGKKQIFTPPPVKAYAIEHSIPVLQPANIRGDQFRNKLKHYAPGVIIVVAYGKIIPNELLKIPAYGWLNVHASLLPKYRGASPIQAAILAGEQKTGVTLMKLDSGLDTGPIISQKTTACEESDTAETLHAKLAALGAEIIRADLLPYLEGTTFPVLQNSVKATLTKIIRKEDGKIDWQKPAEYIERQIRAYTPWPGTYCLWSGKRLKIIRARMYRTQKTQSPGSVAQFGDTVAISTGKDCIAIEMLQLEGKKPLLIMDFLKGYPGFRHAHLT